MWRESGSGSVVVITSFWFIADPNLYLLLQRFYPPTWCSCICWFCWQLETYQTKMDVVSQGEPVNCALLQPEHTRVPLTQQHKQQPASTLHYALVKFSSYRLSSNILCGWYLISCCPWRVWCKRHPKLNSSQPMVVHSVGPIPCKWHYFFPCKLHGWRRCWCRWSEELPGFGWVTEILCKYRMYVGRWSALSSHSVQGGINMNTSQARVLHRGALSPRNSLCNNV